MLCAMKDLQPVWDPLKANVNVRKHEKESFEEAQLEVIALDLDHAHAD